MSVKGQKLSGQLKLSDYSPGGLSGIAFNLLLSCLLWGTALWILIFAIPMDAVSIEPGSFVQKLQSVVPLTCSFVAVKS